MASPRLSLASAAGLLLLLPSTTAAVDIWAFDIDNNPAPSPQDGPPFSANASRDPALLKWQILGIAGGYVLFVLVTFTLLLTVGKRLRRAAQSSTGSLSMEMVKPNRWMGDPSPPGHNDNTRGWGTVGRAKSPASTTVASFDPTVIEADKRRREQEMERLYAAVLQGDTISPKEVLNKSQEWGRASDTESVHTRGLASPRSVRSFSQRIPPQAHSRNASSSGDFYASPGPGPATVDRLPEPPTYVPATYTSAAVYGSIQRPNMPPEPAPQPRPSHSRQASASSTRSKKSRSVRNLTISSPIPSQGFQEDDYDSVRTPLTPRHYNPPPPPQPPTSHRPVTPIQDSDDTDDADIIDAYGYEGLAQPHPPPRSAPQRHVSQQQLQQSYPPVRTASAGAHSSNNTLPLRAYTPASTAASVSRHNIEQALPSPGPIKTTLLSPRKHHPPGWAPLGTGRTPITAGLATPYSPYMPSTPMTPVTPHLTNRAERRQRAREQGRRVATVEEQVPDDEEVWGGGL